MNCTLFPFSMEKTETGIAHYLEARCRPAGGGGWPEAFFFRGRGVGSGRGVWEPLTERAVPDPSPLLLLLAIGESLSGYPPLEFPIQAWMVHFSAIAGTLFGGGG